MNETNARGRWLGHAAAIVFTASMFLPAVHIGVDWRGYEAAWLCLASTALGWHEDIRGMERLAYALGSLSNLLFMTGYIIFLVRSLRGTRGRPIGAVVMAAVGCLAGTISVAPYLLEPDGSNHLCVGFYLWIASQALLAIAAWRLRVPRIEPRGFAVLLNE